MADLANVITEKSSQNQSTFEVITLSSDEEQPEKDNVDVNFLFKRFILACRPHVPKDAIKEVRSLFTEVQKRLSESHNVVNILKRHGKEINKNNADLYLSLICSALTEEKSKKEKNIEVNSVCDNQESRKVAKSVTFCDVIAARGFEPNTKLSSNQNDCATTSTIEIANISDDDDFVSRKASKEKPGSFENMPSTSNQNAFAENNKGKILTSKLTAKQKKKLVAQLKQRLKEISNEIKILDRAELTLEEMDMSDSTYIKENRLKKKFEKTWNKLCKILGRPPNTGRVVEKVIRASSTGYSMIDKAVAKFLKEKHTSFPDYFDIRDIVLKANQTHDLRMSPQVLNGIIADLFTDIGNKLQRRRERDLLFNFGSHLLDDFNADNDPALTDKNLANQLEKNRRISKRNLKHVYAKYTHLERYRYDDKTRKSSHSSMVNMDSDSDSSASEDKQNTEGLKNLKKYARLDRREVMGKSIMKRLKGSDNDSSGSSENEEDLSRIQDDNSVMIDDSDMASSQEMSFVSSACKTDISLSHSEQSLLDTDQVAISSSNNKHSGLQTFPLTCQVNTQQESEMPKQTASTFDPQWSHDDSRTDQRTFSSSSDCEIINDPKEELFTQVNKPLIPENQSNTNFEIVSKPARALEPTKPLGEPVNEAPVSDKHMNTDDDCEIVNDPKQQSVTLKQRNEPAEEPVYKPIKNTVDECLIIDDDDPPTQSTPLKIQTSAPSAELTKTINVLLEVFRKRSKPDDQSEDPVSSCGEPASTTAPDSLCKTESSNSKSLQPNSSVSQTSTSKDWASGSTSHNLDDESVNVYSDPKAKCATVRLDNDASMSSNQDSLKDSVEILSDCSQSPKINHTNYIIPSTSSISPSTPRGTDNTPTPSNTSPSSSKSCTGKTGSPVNQRKRKATAELSVQIPKSSIRYLEHLAWSLKNKRLKLPDAWVNSVNDEKNSDVSPQKPTILKESPTVSNVSLNATTSKETSTVGNASLKPTTSSKGSSIVTQTSSENNSPLLKGSGKIERQQRQVFRGKTLDAFKVSSEPACNNNVNIAFQSVDLTPSNKNATNISLSASNSVDNADINEVIIIDD